MWWSRAVTAVAVAALLCGCGFRPLYGRAENGTQVALALSQIHVATIPDRTGQKLRNFLLDGLNPKGQPARPLYILHVEQKVTRTDLGIKRDETATRALLVLLARYSLVDASGKTTLVNGTTQSTNSFNIAVSDFATLSAENDAIERAAREVSDEIKTRLALYFSRPRS